ncbi:hypothetical protein WA1_13150 [Scytonema hofmannii PCC 7110]|uniref:DarT domain-containing protein n=1 Tax=Scytonema hofmannii PCC 7110 TaxID=128403 RepID=A0A139XEG7_9CYAN|nr:DarT ssDNA thymidine ADP-ribosyltransferase family protein [Scytonema hofmannii]KYC43043.1 hypothetical protein WA1_13150 [Scytonema hofmannii PCC 7110]
MFKELRYLLHGNKQKYEDITTLLYITSSESTLWQKIGEQVLQRKGEAWRLLHSVLVEHIPTAKRQSLGITTLQPEQVVDLIRELSPECVDGHLLDPSERYELLRYINQRSTNEDLWKALQVHEATNGQLVRIEADKMYLENQDFSFDERLQNYVVLIRENKQELKQDWIPRWTPQTAIATILKLSNPHEYWELILDALQRMSPQERESWRSELQITSWLPCQGRGISPQDVIKLPDNLVKHEQAIASLDGAKYPEKILPNSVRTSSAYAWVIQLFTYWNAETVIRKVLAQAEKSLKYWSRFSMVILDAIQDLEIQKDLELLLKTEKWLFLEERCIAPEQVIEIPKELKQHLTALVDLSPDEYTEYSRLTDEIRTHKSFKKLSKLFCRWYENDIISFILRQRQPHEYLHITLDALNYLFSNFRHLNTNNDSSLRTTAWLADAQGKAVHPHNVLHYPSIKNEIEELLLVVPSTYVASSQLTTSIRKHESCWQWLTQELFITQDKALARVGELLKQALEYQLGEFELDEYPIDDIFQVFNKLEICFLPVCNLAKKINIENFKKYLLPNLLGKIDEEKLVKLFLTLASTSSQPEESILKVFNCYLELAVRYNRFQQIIEKIRLLNRNRQWQASAQLTWGNMDNIDPASVLDSTQAEIMSSYLNLLPKTNLAALSTLTSAVEETNYSVLKKYFYDWDLHCPSEPIGAFLSLLYGGEGNVKHLASCYLGKRDLGNIRQRIFEDKPIPNRVFRIHVGQASDRTRNVQSLLGHTFKVSLANTKRPSHLFVSKLAPDVTDIELIPIQPQEFIPSELIKLLKNSTRVLLKDVYRLTPLSLDEIWEDLCQSDQLDIQVAKNLLLESAPSVMRMLGAHKRSSAINSILTHWDNLRRLRAELRQQKKSTEKLDEQIENLISKLSNLLESESSESEQLREQLWQAVRAKIKEQGYRLQSIAFELFQNADDAVIEWMGMTTTKKLEEKRKQFIVVCTDNKLLFIHVGRPIGCFQHPERPEIQYRDKGFDRDLEKMLTFNISDKGDGVTGKFGLGFKSIYLACKQPCVLSKNLGFSVAGGLIPSRLNHEKTNELREYLQHYIELPDATIVELALEQKRYVQDIVKDFQELISILLVFAKGIKTCRFINQQHPEERLSWNPSPVLNVPGVETSKYRRASDDRESILLCFRIPGEDASLLLGIFEQNGRLYPALPKDTPTFWVTAPTREQLFLGFVLNADLDITPGRESLVKSSTRNRQLARRIGKGLGEVLHNLRRASEDNWQALAATLGIPNTDEYEFWNFLWNTLAVSWQQKDQSEGIDIIRNMLTGDRTMGYLITRCQSLPTGLYSYHRQLISLDNVKYRVTGKLLDQSCFLKVANWSNFQQQYQGNLIAHERWEEVKKLLEAAFDERRYKVTDLQLLDVLKNEIGMNEPKVTLYKASYIGELISKEFFNSFNISSELSHLQSFLETVRFLSKAGTYLTSQKLLDSQSNTLEENLLVGFAPDDRILHSDYNQTALNFFYACRLRRDSVSKDEIVIWVLQAQTDEQRQAVYVYLLRGEKREEIAPILYSNREGYWFGSHRQIIDILEYMVLIVIEREKVIVSLEPPKETSGENEEIEAYNPFFEIQSTCTRNDFSLERAQQEQEAFARVLLDGLNRQSSSWKGYIYHFTHIENAVSILQGERLLARNKCNNFRDSAGASLIAHTSKDVKDFARFYFRPKTPTQWHNESLGKRKGKIYALCPVPIFFCVNLERVLETHGSKCGISNGNLAASGSHYGNSVNFLKESFDFNHVYSTLQEVGKEIFLRASQQEFIIHHYLDFTKLNLEDISLICRNTHDKQLLLHLMGRNSKYAHRVFEEKDILDKSLFYHENPYIKITNHGQYFEVEIEKYESSVNMIEGELYLKFTQETLLNREISSKFHDISKVLLGESTSVTASRNIQLQYKPNTRMSVYFKEYGKDWLIYTNEPQNH